MRLERLTGKTHKMYEKSMELYYASFPFHEQREEASQIKILADGEYHFSLVYDENVFVGLILYWETERFIYVEHFCILPEMRNKNYGKRTLECLGEWGKTVILEIDPPVDTISVRRKGFYERSGFVENPYPHVHPPYHKGTAGHELVIMSFPDRITQREYDGFRQYLDHRVMKCVFS